MRTVSSDQKELHQLYKKWPEVKRLLRTFGCPKDLAEDIFQEALIIYCRKKETVDFVLTTEPIAYVKSTCKLLWYNQARKMQKQPVIPMEKEDLETADEAWLEREVKFSQMENALKQLGEQCRNILEMFYGFGLSMVEIAKKTGLRNDKVAKVQKYRCLQKAKELVSASGSSSFHA